MLAFAGALACVPLAYAAEALGATPMAASRIGILWCLCPALANFSPYLDQALALPMTCALALLLAATVRSRPLALTAPAAGAMMAAASLVSYGSVGMLAVTALVVTAAAGNRLGRALAAIAIAGAAAAVLLALCRAVGFDYVSSAIAALTLHRVQFTEHRSYSIWLGFNLIDFAVFAGLPVIACGVLSSIAGLARRGWRDDTALRALIALFGGLLLLDATGTVRGEVGRLWLPLMPMFYLGLLGARERAHPEGARRVAPTVADAALTASLLAALTITLRLRWGP